jgi:hypothetical protein
VALKNIICPECNTKLKSPTGFLLGATVSCPKCETDFTVREPDDKDGEHEEPKKGADRDAPTKQPVKASAGDGDEWEDEAPKKNKKKPAYDEDDVQARSYKNSPLRYAILGVLVLTMLVLGYFLFQKWKTDREMAQEGNARSDDDARPVNLNQPLPPPPVLGGAPNPKFPNPKFPNPKGPFPKQPGGKTGAGGPAGGFDPVGGLLGTKPATDAEIQARLQKFKTALVGTWTADLGAGANEELTYTAEGTFTAKQTGPDPATASGKYTVQQVVGTKGLRLLLDDGTSQRTIIVNFEGEELEHPTLQKGLTGAFRKK